MILLDNFNRADGGLGSNWTSPIYSGTTDTPRIVSNYAQPTSNDGTEGGAYWNARLMPASNTITTTLTIASAPGPTAYLYSLLAASGVSPSALTAYVNSMEFTGAACTYAVYRCNAGSFTGALGRSGGFTPVTGDVISVQNLGGAFTVKMNGGTILTFTDPSPLSADGYIGFGGNTNHAGFDDFSVETTGAAIAVATDTIVSHVAGRGAGW